jgi:hypothetical protein
VLEHEADDADRDRAMMAATPSGVGVVGRHPSVTHGRPNPRMIRFRSLGRRSAAMPGRVTTHEGEWCR